MKQDFSKQSGFTLIEVLASIVILTIMFSALSGFFVNSASYSNTFDKKLTAVQLSRTILESYQEDGYDKFKNLIGPPLELDHAALKEILGIEGEELIDISAYSATVSLKKHSDLLLSEKLIEINVTVHYKDRSSITESTLKGYITK
jgi:prepilin-type N-terminal cleavage/methylation domain-containing protein